MKKWVLCSLLLSLHTQAASISTYRIYLDNDNRQQKFMVRNASAIPEKCDISFSYMAYEENGQAKKLSKEQQDALSTAALNHLRYSPSQFTIEPKSSQYIAFNYRRQINDAPAEYRTYVNIKCISLDDQTKQGISLTPTIMHSVPLVIRSGRPTELDANLTFTNIERKEDTIAFRLQHQGTRSVYGDLYLVSDKGEKRNLLQRNIVIYPEMQYKDFAFSLKDVNDKNLRIEFQETGTYSNNKQFVLPLTEEQS